jgi:rRNA-processing protein FCF1
MPGAPIIAVDTNFLIDLADEDETAFDCLSTIRRKFDEAPILVLPTVIGELMDISQEGDTPEEKALASKALRSVRVPWGFRPINYVPVGHGIVEQTALKIRAAGLIPDEEVHDSFVIAEAALAKVTILLSSDGHIWEIDQAAVKKVLEACSVGVPIIFSPWKIVKDFFRSVH